MNNRRYEYPKFLTEYTSCNNLTHYNPKMSASLALLGLIIILKTLNKFY